MGYAGCLQIRAVDQKKDEGAVGTVGGCNQRAGCMGGGVRRCEAPGAWVEKKGPADGQGAPEAYGGRNPSGPGLCPPDVNPFFADVLGYH